MPEISGHVLQGFLHTSTQGGSIRIVDHAMAQAIHFENGRRGDSHYDGVLGDRDAVVAIVVYKVTLINGI